MHPAIKTQVKQYTDWIWETGLCTWLRRKGLQYVPRIDRPLAGRALRVAVQVAPGVGELAVRTLRVDSLDRRDRDVHPRIVGVEDARSGWALHLPSARLLAKPDRLYLELVVVAFVRRKDLHRVRLPRASALGGVLREQPVGGLVQVEPHDPRVHVGADGRYIGVGRRRRRRRRARWRERRRRRRREVRRRRRRQRRRRRRRRRRRIRRNQRGRARRPRWPWWRARRHRRSRGHRRRRRRRRRERVGAVQNTVAVAPN